jgi:hypothetical protein
MLHLSNVDFLRLEATVWVAISNTHIPAYDFQFYPLFAADRPYRREAVPVVARIGAIGDYEALYHTYAENGFLLINDMEQHRLASELSEWYPLISDLTPKSKVYEHFPSQEALYADFTFPVFIKGNRQTARHDSALSIAHNEADFDRIHKAYAEHPILHWQHVVCRQYIALQKIGGEALGRLPLSFEFRTFWWKGKLVGAGHYWSQFAAYQWTGLQQQEAIAVASAAVERLKVPFIVVDMALTDDGRWIVIECNDAQESGYCGADRAGLWRNIIATERGD